jgi:hypothetical protein
MTFHKTTTITITGTEGNEHEKLITAASICVNE